jgi:hypothetical protein
MGASLSAACAEQVFILEVLCIRQPDSPPTSVDELEKLAAQEDIRVAPRICLSLTAGKEGSTQIDGPAYFYPVKFSSTGQALRHEHQQTYVHLKAFLSSPINFRGVTFTYDALVLAAMEKGVIAGHPYTQPRFRRCTVSGTIDLLNDEWSIYDTIKYKSLTGSHDLLLLRLHRV